MRRFITITFILYTSLNFTKTWAQNIELFDSIIQSLQQEKKYEQQIEILKTSIKKIIILNLRRL